MHIPTPLLNGLLIVLALGLAPAPSRVAAEGGCAVYQSEAAFDDVRQGLKLAIEERGMYINNAMHMGEMLERTGKDLRLGEPIYARAESIEFCSSVLFREMTSEGPARIVNCLIIISVYTLPDKAGTTFAPSLLTQRSPRTKSMAARRWPRFPPC